MEILDMRRAKITRQTSETSISLDLSIDGTGKAEISTGIGFFDHMLTLFCRHALFDMKLLAEGDLAVDFHHTVEDTGIVIGQALAKALGDKAGIRRYGEVHLPMDETLTRVSLDISGRQHLTFAVAFPTQKIGEFDSELVREWFRAFAANAGLTLHADLIRGENSHHIAESCFKGIARALRSAVEIDPRAPKSIPSTKGTLSA